MIKRKNDYLTNDANKSMYSKMSHIIKGIYRHTTSGKLYNVIGVGRAVENPNKLIVIYEQLYDSKFRGTDIPLPKGSLWTRDIDDFDAPIDVNEKGFTKLDSTKK